MARDKREDPGQYYPGGTVIPKTPMPSGGGGGSGDARMLPKYLHYLEFDDSYPEDAAWYYTLPQDYAACSAVRDGAFLFRNYDWKFNDAAEFVVRVSSGSGRFASVGLANCGTNLTEGFVTSGKPSRFYKCLPGRTVDGINENGVVAEINVVDGAPAWNNPDGDIHPLGAVRWVLDNAANALEAATNLATRISFPAGWTQNFHYMVADATSTYIVENGAYNQVSGRAVMTNFRLYPIRDPAGAGQERYDLLSSAGSKITDAWYTGAYVAETQPPWLSDFGNDRALYEAALDYWARKPKEAHRGETLAGMTWWQTVHTSVYDIANRVLLISVQEQDDWYVYQVKTAGGGGGAVDSVNGKTGVVVLTGSDIPYIGETSVSAKLAALQNDKADHSDLSSYLERNGGVMEGGAVIQNLRGINGAEGENPRIEFDSHSTLQVVNDIKWYYGGAEDEDEIAVTGDVDTAKAELNARIDIIETTSHPNMDIVGRPTFYQGTVSGFSVNDYLVFPTQVDVGANEVDFYLAFTTGANVTAQQNILDSWCGLAFAIQNGGTVTAASYNGTEFITSAEAGVVAANSAYRAKFSFRKIGEKYTVTTYLANGAGEYQQVGQPIVMPAPLHATATYWGGANPSSGVPHIYGGSINLAECRMDWNGKTVWRGYDELPTVKFDPTAEEPLDTAEKIVEKAKSESAYKINLTNEILDRAINVTSAAAITIPDSFTDLIIRATVGSNLDVTVPASVVVYGDLFPSAAGEYLITVTKVNNGEAYVRTIKLEEAA